MKKGVMTPVFTYIFAVIAGVIILLFFLGFAMKHKGVASSLEAAESAHGFDNFLTAFGAVRGEGQKLFSFPFETRIVIHPSEIIFISGTRNSSKDSRNIIYSPARLFGKKLLALTIRWRLPYSVVNFFYLTNDDYRYLIVYKQEHEDFKTQYLELGIPKEVKPASKFVQYPSGLNSLDIVMNSFPETVKEVRFVTLGLDNSKIAALKNKVPQRFKNRYSIVTIEPLMINNKLDYEYGQVTFIKGGSEDTREYLGLAMMYGAIFAEDVELYDHAYQLAMERLSNITEMYSRKIDYIIEPAPCDQNGYALLKLSLNELKAYSKDSGKTADQFRVVVEKIETTNKEVMGRGCAALF